jgi:uncharacterized protein (DUF427 family)
MAHSVAYDRHPEHTLDFDEQRVRVRVRVGDQLIAQTSVGLTLREGKYPAVVYIPREDVRMDLLTRSEHSTHCPFKGDASYFDYQGGGDGESNQAQIAWSYEDPFDQMRALQNHLAFYTDRVTVESDSD